MRLTLKARVALAAAWTAAGGAVLWVVATHPPTGTPLDVPHLAIGGATTAVLLVCYPHWER